MIFRLFFVFLNICVLFQFLRQIQNHRTPLPPCLRETKYEQTLFCTPPLMLLQHHWNNTAITAGFCFQYQSEYFGYLTWRWCCRGLINQRRTGFSRDIFSFVNIAYSNWHFSKNCQNFRVTLIVRSIYFFPSENSSFKIKIW